MFVLKKWHELPDFLQCDEVREYYEILNKKRLSIFLKRLFDLVVALVILIVLLIPIIIISILIKIDSKGPVFFRQRRVTTNGKVFGIHKFRTMVENAEKLGSGVTVKGDARITKVGRILRKFRLDEIPQLLDVLVGNMSFVGTRPESIKYVEFYTKEMNATLLLPAGITSEASIRYKDEAMLLDVADDVDKVYVENVLPGKMKYNLNSIRDFSLGRDIATMFRTFLAVLGKEYL